MSGGLMHAVQYDSCGTGAAGLKHVEVAIPSPQKGEVLVKVEALSLNPADWKIQKGTFRPILPRKFPFIPGTDVAGEIVAVGPDVTSFKEGGLAEHALAAANLTIKRPPELPPGDASGLCIAGLTALAALKSAGIKFDGSDKPANILVTAASGGVGHYAVQLAKIANLHVTATCGARNLELVKSLGADEVLDYKTPEGGSMKSPSNLKYDIAINCVSGTKWSNLEPNLSDDGKVVDVAPDFSSFFTCVLKKLTFSRKKLMPVVMAPNRENLQFLVDLAKDGKIKTLIDSKYPLSNAVDAWAKTMDGHATGKVIVEINKE